MKKFQDNLKIIHSYISENILPRFKFDIPAEKLIIYATMIGLIALLIANIYSSIGDIQNYKILENEKAIYEQLLADNIKLKKDKDYYQSSYFKQLYARESLSLGKENQLFFLVDRGTSVDYSSNEENPDPIQKQNFRFWWKKLIL